eukprot:4398183-Pyramimonas_sp.AAC.1
MPPRAVTDVSSDGWVEYLSAAQHLVRACPVAVGSHEECSSLLGTCEWLEAAADSLGPPHQ